MDQIQRTDLGEPLLRMPLAPPDPADFVHDASDEGDCFDLPQTGCYDQIGLSSSPECTDYKAIECLFRGVADPHSEMTCLVRSSVRGFVVDAFSCSGRRHALDFRLSKDVDALEFTSYENAQSFKIKFADISNICTGDEASIQHDLAQSYKGLDSQSAVLELINGTCFALRFRTGDWADKGEETRTFVRCMQTFVLLFRQQKMAR
eukprot:CAMPEP_0169109492 /NCGR_PEP_ID=MMETSP1015-20121227/25994_1 /TAXON_ID=342587 /ORGANISM="Karlodinium micrum, Strain CCMP2283" /LENGTH=204 /DNA_ID=CAMNT_0009171193 /DNA_START=50 /DNA_END=664 /DNA_ORIENTATION=+